MFQPRGSEGRGGVNFFFFTMLVFFLHTERELSQPFLIAGSFFSFYLYILNVSLKYILYNMCLQRSLLLTVVYIAWGSFGNVV